MQEVIILNEVPVEILYYGGISPTEMLRKKIEERPKELVLFIPGCPGIIQDYDRFGQQLEKNLKIPTWLVGYGGFSRKIDLPKKPRHNAHLYDVLAQINQKKELVVTYLEGVSIYLIAHSFGCCLSLEIMKDESVSKQLNAVYFIFPMFQDADSLEVVPKILAITDFIKIILPYIEPIAKLLLKSSQIRKWSARLASNQLGWSKCESMPNLFHVDVIWSFITNVDCIKEQLRGKPYNAILRKHANKIKIWCTRNDPFNDETFCENLRKTISGLWVEYIDLIIPHSFQHYHNGVTADALSDLIECDKIKASKP